MERRKRNDEMLNIMLDEWIPWHKENPDLSTVEKYASEHTQLLLMDSILNGIKKKMNQNLKSTFIILALVLCCSYK